MRILSTRIHGLIDYLWGVLLVATPFLLDWPKDAWPSWVAWAAGAGAILYSLLTDYETGLLRLIPMPMHLGLDAMAGAGLLILAVVSGALSQAGIVFGAFGAFSVVASLVTKTRPTHQVPFS